MTSVPQTDAAQRFRSGQPLQSVATRPDISVLVPAKDEAENLPLFMEQARAVFAAQPNVYEIVVVDDGSVDDTWNVLQRLTGQYPFLHAVRHGARRGIADALRTGYLHSRGNVLVFYPADLQYKPEDIPRLVEPILSGKSDMVARARTQVRNLSVDEVADVAHLDGGLAAWKEGGRPVAFQKQDSEQ